MVFLRMKKNPTSNCIFNIQKDILGMTWMIYIKAIQRTGTDFLF